MENIRLLKKLINTLHEGDTFYFNAISASPRMIDYIRELLKGGRISPNPHELDKMIKPEAHVKFYSGECIAPQMEYMIISEEV